MAEGKGGAGERFIPAVSDLELHPSILVQGKKYSVS